MSHAKSHDERFAKMTFSSVYPLYLAKVEKKGRTRDELDRVFVGAIPQESLRGDAARRRVGRSAGEADSQALSQGVTSRTTALVPVGMALRCTLIANSRAPLDLPSWLGMCVSSPSMDRSARGRCENIFRWRHAGGTRGQAEARHRAVRPPPWSGHQGEQWRSWFTLAAPAARPQVASAFLAPPRASFYKLGGRAGGAGFCTAGVLAAKGPLPYPSAGVRVALFGGTSSSAKMAA